MKLLEKCPPKNALLDFTLGKLSEDDSDSIASHLESCEQCLEQLDRVEDENDPLVQDLRQPLAEDRFLREPECKLASRRGLKTPAVAQDVPTVLRDYELLEKLGQGGMGSVYSALHKKLGRKVAVKLLPQDAFSNKQSVARFEREMRAIGRSQHPNIVQAHDAGEFEGRHYLVMELLDGIDLSVVARRVGALPITDACELVRQAALGLEHAHEHELVHRDIKPSNLMLTRSGNVKILDLGLARLEEISQEAADVTTTGQIMGTLDYMAPEQLGDSHDVDHRADIYGLGATLYKLLTGHLPYSDHKYNTPGKKVLAITTTPVEPARNLREDLPPELSALLETMLVKLPGGRFDSAQYVAQVLEPFCAGANLQALYQSAEHAAEASTDKALVRKSTLKDLTSPFSTTDADQSSSVSPKPLAPLATSWRPPTKWSVAVAAMFFLVAALTIFYIQSGKATLVVEFDDAQVGVMLEKSGGLVVEERETGRRYTVVTEAGTKDLKPGDYRLTIRDSSGLEIVGAKEFALKRGDSKSVSIRFASNLSETVAKSTETEKLSPSLNNRLSPALANSSSSTELDTGSEQWIDLLALVDPQKNPVENGAWVKTEQGYHVNSGRRGKIHFPIEVNGSYELRVTLSHDNEQFTIALPVGTATGMLLFSSYDKHIALDRINGVSGKSDANPTHLRYALADNERHTVRTCAPRRAPSQDSSFPRYFSI